MTTCAPGDAPQDAGVSKDAEREAAEKWLKDFRIPEAIDGRTVDLVAFTSDEECRFFYPQRTALWQQKVNRQVAIAVRRRGGKVWRTELTRARYFAWLGIDPDHLDVAALATHARPRNYADSLQGKVDAKQWGTAAAS